MTTHRWTRTIDLVLLAGVLLPACSDDQRTPTQPRPPIDIAGSTSADVVRLLIKAPASIAPQESAQLHASAMKADGTTEDVTSQTQWSTADPNAVLVERGGIVTGLKVGEVGITAAYQSAAGTRYGSASVIVLMPGTYKLSGRITDNGVAVARAGVTVVDGSGVNLTALTGLDGAFALYGIAGRVQLRASREGYATVTAELDVTQTSVRNIEMIPDRTRLDLSGSYTLVLRSGACDDRADGIFGSEFANRRYVAAVTQTGPTLAVSLSGADFLTRDGRGDHFDGSVDPVGNVTFAIGDPDDLYLSEYPDLVERVNPSSAFLAYGTVKAQATSTALIGTIAGPFVIAPANNPSFWARSAWCYSEGHSFEMRRQ